MPKAAVLQSSFSSGEVSPLYYGQADNPRYKKGLASGLNILPLLQGPVVRRPGTKFCAHSKLNAAPILVPFIFSETQAYMLEFGNQYVRFYANNAQILTTGTTYELIGTTSLGLGYDDPSIPVTTPFGFLPGNIGAFYATRATTQIQDSELNIVQSTTLGTGVILEMGSPYAVSDLPQLRWVQNNDTLYLVHPKYPIYKLQRQAQTYWRLIPVAIQDGPYFALNTYETFGDFSNISIEGISAVQSTPNFATVTFRSVGITITSAVTDPLGSGQIQITTSSNHGLLSGQNVFITGIVGTTEANNWDKTVNPGGAKAYWSIQVTSPTTFLLQGSTFVNAYGSGGTEYPVIMAPSATAYKIDNTGGPAVLIPDSNRIFGFTYAGIRSYGYLPYYVMNQNAATFDVVWPGYHTTYPNTPLTAWQLGAYSPGFGFPTCVSFHQNRLCLAGPGGAPQEVDGSTVGNYENFAPSDPATLEVSDSNAFSYQLNSSDSNVMQWLTSTAQGLLAGTYVAEWVMSPDSTSLALTPTNFNAQQSSFFGSAPAAAVQLGNSTLYIQRASRKIREMSFFFAAGTFRSIDMTELSEHITIPEITQLAVTKETQPIIWGVRGDGALVSMIFNRDDLSLIAGWTRHVLGGQSDSAGTQPIVSSIASIPSPDLSFDQLWMVVQRYINGSTVYSIEFMTKIFDDSVLQEDAFQLDGGQTFYNPLTITGISTANPAVVTCSSVAGISNGSQIKIVGVVGLNQSTTDVNGNVTITNLVNEKTFVVAGLSGSTFQLNDFNGNPVSSLVFGAYVSGGYVAKLVSTVSGATWLEGETVSLLLDGGIAGTAVVSSGGVITLPYPAAKVQLGYSYPSQLQLLRADAGAPDGTSIGKTRRTTRLAVQLHRSGDLSLGTDFKNLIPCKFSQIDIDEADQAVPLYSGMHREGLESAYDFESQPCLQMSSALPACIQSTTSFMEEFDV